MIRDDGFWPFLGYVHIYVSIIPSYALSFYSLSDHLQQRRTIGEDGSRLRPRTSNRRRGQFHRHRRDFEERPEVRHIGLPDRCGRQASSLDGTGTYKEESAQLL